MSEIETFLLNQLNDAIQKTEIPVFLRECIQAIESKVPNTGAADESIRKEKLYYLNNVIAEWQMLLKKGHSQCTPEAIQFTHNLRGSLKKIKSELNAPPPKKAEGAGAAESKKAEGAEAAESPKKAEGAEAVASPKKAQGAEAAASPKKAEGAEAAASPKKAEGAEDGESYRWSSHSVDPTQIYGIEDKSMVMERLLVGKEKKDGFEAIGIVGMTGVGKTTLCQVAFNNQEVKKHYLPRIWVFLSKQPKGEENYEKEVVKSFLMCLGVEDKIIDKIGQNSDGLRRLLFALRQQLMGKKYLIVLDDVWNLDERFHKFCTLFTEDVNNQEKLAYGLPKGHGGTVIVTSRSEKMAAEMFGEKNLISLVPHADKESCWKIFLDTVGEDKLTKDMKKLKDEIVKNCASLPLVAKMMGQIELKKQEDHSKIKA